MGPRFTTLHVRFLSHEPPAVGLSIPNPPIVPAPLSACVAGGAQVVSIRSLSSGHGSKKTGPPCALASQVTQPRPCRDFPVESRPSEKLIGILMIPSLSTSWGPPCSTTVPCTSTATSSDSNDTASRTTISPLLEPLEKTTFQRAV